VIVEESKLAGLTKMADNRGTASLPILQDWQLWWKEWGPRIQRDVGRQGWVLFVLDANEKLLEMSTLVSRIIRGKPSWDSRGWTENEYGNVESICMAGLRWFERHAEAVQKDAPEWAKFILAAQYGNFSALARLGRELRGLQEAGYSTVVLETNEGGDINVLKGGDKFLEETA
jgi:hypothetical protein